MSNNNELFPFPPADNDNNKPADRTALPAFPDDSGESLAAGQLSESEVRSIRRMLKWFNQNHAAAPAVKQVNPAPAVQSAPSSNQSLADLWQRLPGWLHDESGHSDLKPIIESIGDGNQQKQVMAAIFGLFPIKKFLRHGTPEQQLFALLVVSERFLESISGIVFANRKKLLQVVGRVLSDACERYSFIQTEGENFNPQNHERVQGASSAGRVIREMRSFLVVERATTRIIRSSQVIT